MLTVSDVRYTVLSVKPTVKLEVASVWLAATVYVPVRLVFAGEGKSLQKLVLLLPELVEPVVTVTFRRYEEWSGEVTLIWRVYVEFAFPPLTLTVRFAFNPS